MARRSILNRSFSTREKGLLLALVVMLLVASYYFLVVRNVADTLAENQSRMEEIQQQIDQQTALATVRQKMQSELDELGEVKDLPEVAVYDNLRNELNELNSLMAQTTVYDVNFKQPERDGDLVRRAVSVSFTVSTYQQAFDIVRSLEDGPYRCEISDFSLVGKMLADGNVESVSATLNVTYLETTRGATNLNGLVDKKK